MTRTLGPLGRAGELDAPYACRLSLVIALVGAAEIAPAALSSNPVFAAAKKKKKKSTTAKTPAEPKKVTAQSILQMHKKGMTDDEIVARADKAGYSMSAKDRATLKKGHAPKSLMSALDPQGASEPAPAKAAPVEKTVVAEKKPEPINIHKVTDPNDIDFDSVPPPAGMPKQYTQHQEPAKKQLDRSTRPPRPSMRRKKPRRSRSRERVLQRRRFLERRREAPRRLLQRGQLTSLSFAAVACASPPLVSTQPSKELDTFPNPNPARDYEVAFECPEFTCLCPMTGQPDFATFRITYVPESALRGAEVAQALPVVLPR